MVTHPSKKVQAQLKAAQEHVNSALSLSDSLNNKNLLRFYVPTGFTPVDPKDFNYKNQVEQLDKIQAKLKGRSTSLWSKIMTTPPPINITPMPQNLNKVTVAKTLTNKLLALDQR